MTDNQFHAALATVAEFAPPGSRWRHRKGGTYTVAGAAIIEATREPAVVYASTATGVAWCRPLAEFADGRFGRMEGDEPAPADRATAVVADLDRIARETDRYEYGLPVYHAAAVAEMAGVVEAAIREAVASAVAAERERCAARLDHAAATCNAAMAKGYAAFLGDLARQTREGT